MSTRIYLGYTSAIEAWRAYSAHAGQRAIRQPKEGVGPFGLPGCGTLRNLETNASTARVLIRDELGFELSEPLHLVVSGECKPRKTPGIVWHRTTLDYPPRSFIKLSDRVFSASPELTFTQLGSTSTLIKLISLGYELCGTYTNGPGCSHDAITTKRKLKAFAEKIPSVNGARRAQRAARYVLDGSASPMETAIAMELTLPYLLGGKNFPPPSLNKSMTLSKAASKIAGRRSLVYDLYWPEAKLAIEYDSRQFHSSDSARIKDSQKRAAAAEMGVSLISITERQYRNILEFDEITQMLARALEHEIRPRAKEYRQKRLLLRSQLNHLYDQSKANS